MAWSTAVIVLLVGIFGQSGVETKKEGGNLAYDESETYFLLWGTKAPIRFIRGELTPATSYLWKAENYVTNVERSDHHIQGGPENRVLV